jgi:cell division transport system permease protein
MRVWSSQHWHTLLGALRKLLGQPLAGILNVAVIGVALSLPVGLYVVLSNLQAFAHQFSAEPQISVFLELGASPAEIADITARLKRNPAVADARFVPRDKALLDLKQSAGLADVIESLPQNPLPDAFVLHALSTSPDAMEKLSAELRRWPKVAHVQFDSAWARRLDAVLKLGRAAALMLALLLSFSLVAVAFNTIRLQILTQQEEIEVSKLIGATNPFVRRPFLYFGAVQGLAGGIAAWVIVTGCIYLLNGNLAELSKLYASGFRLQPPNLADSLSLVGFSVALGWLGAWLSVSRHLRHSDAR